MFYRFFVSLIFDDCITWTLLKLILSFVVNEDCVRDMTLSLGLTVQLVKTLPNLLMLLLWNRLVKPKSGTECAPHVGETCWESYSFNLCLLTRNITRASYRSGAVFVQQDLHLSYPSGTHAGAKRSLSLPIIYDADVTRSSSPIPTLSIRYYDVL